MRLGYRTTTLDGYPCPAEYDLSGDHRLNEEASVGGTSGRGRATIRVKLRHLVGLARLDALSAEQAFKDKHAREAAIS